MSTDLMGPRIDIIMKAIHDKPPYSNKAFSQSLAVHLRTIRLRPAKICASSNVRTLNSYCLTILALPHLVERLTKPALSTKR